MPSKTTITTGGFKIEQDAEDQLRNQRQVDRKTKDKTKITNQDIWDLLMDIQAEITK